MIDLIITIIVLLILAGITIATLIGKNGIITNTQSAKKQNLKADVIENISLALLAIDIEVRQQKTRDSSYVPKDHFDNGANGLLSEKIVGEQISKGKDNSGDGYRWTTSGTIIVIAYNSVPESIKVEGSIDTNESGEITEAYNPDEPLSPGEKDSDVDTPTDRTGIKIGDYIDYTPTPNSTGYSIEELTDTITGSTINTSTINQDNLNWQVLRIYDDGSLDLIGSTTSQNVYLKGAKGYNNGITVLNNICNQLYSRGNIKARSVNYEIDIEPWLTDDGKSVRDNYTSNDVSYTQTKTYESGNAYYPNEYNDVEITGTVKANGYSQATEQLIVKQTEWKGSMNQKNFGEGYKALKTSDAYWVSSRFAFCGKDYANFGLRYVNNFRLDCYGIASSRGNSNDGGNRLRPVVTLGPKVQIEASGENNGITNMHKITQY